MIASPPKASTAVLIRASSVATTTRETWPARRTLSTTCWIMGLPAIGASGFPGKRDDACRAGITARTFVEVEFAINSPGSPPMTPYYHEARDGLGQGDARARIRVALDLDW